MNLSLVINPIKPSILQALVRIRKVVPEGHRLMLGRDMAEEVQRRPDYRDQLAGYEITEDIHLGEVVLALGGDGTLLTALRRLQQDLRPLLGINLGSLGFLTDTPEQQLEAAIEDVLAGNYRLDPRMLVEATYHPLKGEALRLWGLNDVVLNHGPLARVLELALRAGGVDLGSTMADGVIVATPSGSTAYNLSAGGPIVSPRLRALLMTPINAHTLSMRPLVVAAEEGIDVRLLRTSTTRAELTVDGHTGPAMREGEHVVLRAAPRDLQLVVTRATSFYETLRTKLGWGLRGGSGSLVRGG